MNLHMRSENNFSIARKIRFASELKLVLLTARGETSGGVWEGVTPPQSPIGRAMDILAGQKARTLAKLFCDLCDKPQ